MMNDRIKELAEQAGFQYEPVKDIWYLEGLNPPCDQEFEKFAQLIVRECLAECWYDATPKQIADNIRQKFGIKE
jgi:hypothetical protein